MKLTAEQEEQVSRSRTEGEHRVSLRLTQHQKEEWREAVAGELEGKQENLAHFRNIKAASERSGFFGDIRRAILLAKRPTSDLAAEIGVDARLLSDFLAGDAELPSAALDRVIELLGLRLMQEIPR